jgi:hypothetical protein
MERSSPADLSENPEVALPPVPQHIAKEHPDVWAALQQLGAALSQTGPLDGRTKMRPGARGGSVEPGPGPLSQQLSQAISSSQM